MWGESEMIRSSNVILRILQYKVFFAPWRPFLEYRCMLGKWKISNLLIFIDLWHWHLQINSEEKYEVAIYKKSTVYMLTVAIGNMIWSNTSLPIGGWFVYFLISRKILNLFPKLVQKRCQGLALIIGNICEVLDCLVYADYDSKRWLLTTLMSLLWSVLSGSWHSSLWQTIFWVPSTW